MDGRLQIRVRTALLLAVAAAFTVVSVPADAGAPPPADVGPASVLSSFSPSFDDRAVVGGTQELSVVASPTGSSTIVVPLTPAPCACVIASVEASAGTVSGTGTDPVWAVGDLAADTRASLVVVWEHSG